MAKIEKLTMKSTKEKDDTAKQDSQVPTADELRHLRKSDKEMGKENAPLDTATKQKIDIARLRERRRERGAPDWDKLQAQLFFRSNVASQ